MCYRVIPLIIAALSAMPCWSQINLGAIRGTITDQSKAPIPGASITVTDTARNLTVTLTSGTDGQFLAPGLRPGRYSLTASQAGFKTKRLDGIEVLTGATLDLTVQLELGAVSEKVEVNAVTPLINVATSEVGGVIESRSILALPLAGRDYLALANLLPGTNPGPPGDARQSGGGVYSGVNSSQGVAQGTVSGSGAQPDQNRFYIDGIDNTDFFQRNPIARPSVDAIQEFQVQLSLPPAEYAGAGGAVVSATTRSGTNALHGAAWDFLRNDKLDARSFFDAQRPIRRRNQYGGVISGPVVIPKLYNGKDRSFFLFNYEGLRFRSERTAIGTVPTTAYRNGDFSGSSTIVYDPLTLTASGMRTPFPGNRIPATRLNPISQNVMALFPTPTGPGIANNLTGVLGIKEDANNYLARFDHYFRDSDRVYARYTQFDDDIPGSALVKESAVDSKLNTKTAALVWTHSVNSNLLFETRVAFTRRIVDQTGTTVDEPDLVRSLGFPLIGYGGVPAQNITNMPAVGGGSVFNNPFASWQGEEKLSWLAGHHSFKTGFGVFWYRLDIAVSDLGGGSKFYDGSLTRQIGAPASTSVEQSVGQFLLGLPNILGGFNIDAGADRSRPRQTAYYAFVQDDWRVSKRLTLNLGLRYDLSLPPTYANGAGGVYFDTSNGTAVLANNAKLPVGCCPYPTALSPHEGIYEKDPYNFGPRFGFAYQLFEDKTVLRGGYGVYYDVGIIGNLAFGAAISAPFGRNAAINVNPDETDPTKFIPIDYNVVLAQGSFPLPASFTGFNQDFKTGMVQQWNLSINHQLARRTALDIAYVGNKGDRLLDANVAVNMPQPGAGSIQARRPFPLFGSALQYSSYGQNRYNSLQVELRQDLEKGFSGLLAYTWAKSIGVLNANNGNASRDGPYQDQYNRRADRSVTSGNVPQRLVISGVYQPLVHASNPFVHALVRDWQIAGVFTVQSGYPYSALLAADVANIGDRNRQRADYLGGGDPNLPRDQRTPQKFFRTELFASPRQYTFGNSGKNILTGDNTRNVDLVISRFFPIRENHRLEFRAEAYNLTNRVTFGFPSFNLGSPTFGTVTTQLNFGRQVQMALKYLF